MNEPKRKRGRPRKIDVLLRDSVLTPEKIAELRSMASKKEQAVERAQEAARQERVAAVEQTRVNNQILAHATKARTLAEFHGILRESLSEPSLKRYLEAQEVVKAMIRYSNEGWQLPPTDEDFMTVEAVIDLFDDHIANHGTIHDIEFESFILQNWHPQWAIYSTEQDVNDPTCPGLLPYWKDTERLMELCRAEGEPTRIYTLYGFETALPQYHVAKFKARIQEHRTTSAAGREMHRIHESIRCYLCRFEATHKF